MACELKFYYYNNVYFIHFYSTHGTKEQGVVGSKERVVGSG